MQQKEVIPTGSLDRERRTRVLECPNCHMFVQESEGSARKFLIDLGISIRVPGVRGRPKGSRNRTPEEIEEDRKRKEARKLPPKKAKAFAKRMAEAKERKRKERMNDDER